AYTQWKRDGQQEQDYQEAIYWLKKAEGQVYQASIILLKELQGCEEQAGEENTALHIAVKQVKALLKEQFEGLNVNMSDFKKKDSNTLLCLSYRALKEAYIKEVKEAIELLLQLGENIHAKNKEGDTALHQAAAEGYVDIVELLLEYGADIH
ncbi:hypothetical protein GR268_45910, partial [Rhizobium leguminosarum]|nr:hypothetical protein [Rhizobium leguminosarum]